MPGKMTTGLGALLLAAGTAQAHAITIGNVEGRKSVSLNGKWQAIIDPYENGYYDYRYLPSPSGYFLNQKPKDKTSLIEYDFDASGTLDVPADWNTQRESLFLYEGTIWYKKSFDYALAPGARLFLHFGAVNQRAVVYLNGEKLGEHEGGFTPFAFEITGQVKLKDNFVVVKADNTRRREGVPTMNTDWWNYGGLTRDVTLVEVPETFVQDYFIQLRPGARDEVAGWLVLNGPRLRQQVAIEIPEARVRQVATTDDSGRAEVRFKARLDLWSPEHPKLYTVTVRAETDGVTEPIGFRSIEARGSEILLNGRPIFLRGVSVHEEAPIRSGRATTAEEARTILSWVKELNGNFVRLAHYPHRAAMTREADRLGVLVWSEVPVYWTILWDNPASYQNAEAQLEENIARDRNRASVILWSVANETPVTEPRTAFLTRLIDHARRLDSTRLLTAALERHWADEKTLEINDPLGAHLDVVGVNEYIGWYDGLPEKCDGARWRMTYDKPLIVSEFGGSALFGRHGDALTRWSEEYQESLYQHQLAMLDQIPFLRGITPWILTDFRSPRRPLAGVQDFFNRKGLVSDRGERKKAFFVLQHYYQERAARDAAAGGTRAE